MFNDLWEDFFDRDLSDYSIFGKGKRWYFRREDWPEWVPDSGPYPSKRQTIFAAEEYQKGYLEMLCSPARLI